MRTAGRISSLKFIALILIGIFSVMDVQASITSNLPAPRFVKPQAAKTKVIRNTLCEKAILDRVEFSGVEGIENFVNFCEAEPKAIPAEVSSVIKKIGELNARVADVLSVKKELLFPMSMNVFFKASANGALAGSQVTGEGVTLTVLPTWKYADFSTMQYAHEIAHVLNFNPGPFADTVLGLEGHPYLVEALPDLISAVVHDSPKITILDPDLPDCLRDFRDGTPNQSLSVPFGHFYPLGSMDEVIACCGSAKALSPYAERLCRGYVASRPRSIAKINTLKETQDLKFLDYTPMNLAAPFEAGNCVVKTPSGLTFLDNCDTHQFGQSLVSFFFRLKELTGRTQFLPFMNVMKTLAPKTARYECGYVAGSPTLGGAKATVRIRPLLGVFSGLRESLNAADQKQFDLAWAEHAMGKLIDLDRLYRNETFSGLAQARVGARNELYTPMFGCENLYGFDPVRCQVSCLRQ